MAKSFLKKVAECFTRLFGCKHTFNIDAFAATDCGKIRPNNEDSLLLLKSTPFYAVCDGMGGTSAGEVASAMMVEALEQNFRNEMGAKKVKDDSKIVKAAKHVNRKIHQYVKEHNLKAMGTTLVCLRMDPNCPARGMVFNAGDSRAYRIRNNSVEQLTNDHSYARKVNIDEQFLTPRQRNSLTNAIGIGKKCYLERTDVDIRTGDLFILCSDGLYRSVNNELLLQTCTDYADKSSEELCRQLIQLALDAGGRDNVSVVVVKVLSTGNVSFMARWKHKEQDQCERIDIGWQNHLTPHTV